MNQSFDIITEDVEVKRVTKRVVGVGIKLTKEQVFLIRDLLGGTGIRDKLEIVYKSLNFSEVRKDNGEDSAKISDIADKLITIFDVIANRLCEENCLTSDGVDDKVDE